MSARAHIDRASPSHRVAPSSPSAPLGFDAGDGNLYRYVRNGPTNVNDPTGLENPGPTLGPTVPNLSFKEQQELGTKLRDEMKTVAEYVARRVADAQRDKDVVKLSCLRDRLKAAQDLLTVAETSFRALDGAVSRRDKSLAGAEYAKIAIAHQKALAVRAEADGCTGEQSLCPSPTVIREDPGPLTTPEDESHSVQRHAPASFRALAGIAWVITSAQRATLSAIQSSADVAIAAINAYAQLTISQITPDTSKIRP